MYVQILSVYAIIYICNSFFITHSNICCKVHIFLNLTFSYNNMGISPYRTDCFHSFFEKRFIYFREIWGGGREHVGVHMHTSQGREGRERISSRLPSKHRAPCRPDLMTLRSRPEQKPRVGRLTYWATGVALSFFLKVVVGLCIKVYLFTQCLSSGCLGYFQYRVSLHSTASIFFFYLWVARLYVRFVRHCQIAFLPSVYGMHGFPGSPVPF